MEFFPKRKVLEQRERVRESHRKDRIRRTKKLAEVDPGLSEPLEKIINRGNRLSGNLDAYCAHYDKIAGLNARRFSFGPLSFEHVKDNAARGLSSALQFLAGGALAVTAPLGRVPGHVVDDAAIAIASSFGAWFASSRLFEAIDYFSPASNLEIAVHGRKRGIPVDRDEDTDQEKVTEYSLRSNMAQLQLEIFSKQRDIEAVLARHRNLLDQNTAEEIEGEIRRIEPEGWKAEDVQQLSVVNFYLEQLIPKQEELLEKAKRYEILSSFHEAERYKKIFGAVAATGILIGGESMIELISRGPEHAAGKMRDFFDIFTKPTVDSILLQRTLSPVFSSLSGTLFALASGMLKVIRETDQGQERSEMVRQRLQEMERDVTKMKLFKNEIGRALREYVAAPAPPSPVADDALTKHDNEQLLREQMQREFDRVIAGVGEAVHGFSGTPDYALIFGTPPPPLEAVEDSAAVATPPEAVRGSVHVENTVHAIHAPPDAGSAFQTAHGSSGVGAIPHEASWESGSQFTPPPTFEGLQYHQGITFRGFFLGLLRMNTHGNPEVPVDDLTNKSEISDVFEIKGKGSSKDVYDPQSGERLPKPAVQRLIRCIRDYRDTVNRHYNPNDKKTIDKCFGVAFNDDLIAKLEELEAVERNREIEEGREFILSHSAQELRAHIVQEFHIARFTGGEASKLDQLAFESLLADWHGKESTRDRDREGLERLLTRFNTALIGLEEEGREIPDRRAIVEVIRGAAQRLNRPADISIPGPEQKQLRAVTERVVRSYYLKEKEIIFKAGGTQQELHDRLEKVKAAPFVTPMSDIITGHGRTEISQIRYKKDGAESEIVDHRTHAVETRLIVGSALQRESLVLPGTDDDILSRASRIVRAPSKDAFHNLFFDHTRGDRERVSLWKFQGPLGDMYFIDEQGGDVVAAAEVAGMPHIIAKVHEVRQGGEGARFVFWLSDSKYDAPRFHLIRALESMRLIEGIIPDTVDFNGEGKQIVMEIKRQVLPWLLWFFPNLPKVTNAYARLYPKLFQELRDLDGQPLSPSQIELIGNEKVFYYRFIQFQREQLLKSEERAI